MSSPGAAHTPFNVQLQLPVLGAPVSIIGAEFPHNPHRRAPTFALPHADALSPPPPYPAADRGEKKWTARLAPTITDVSGISL
jgi:hypothetical protein